MMTPGPSKLVGLGGVIPSFGRFNQVRIVLNFLLKSMLLLGQGATPSADAPAGDAGADSGDSTVPDAPGGNDSFFGQYGMLIPMLMIGVVFYLLLMRPEQKRRKEMEQLLAKISKNDKVILGSGICGTVVNAAPNSVYVTIRVDDSTNTKMRVLRSAIARVGQPDEVDPDAKEAS